MKMRRNFPYILMLEDDADDREITSSFFEQQEYEVGLKFLTNSRDVIPFLENCFINNVPLPGLIMLDKNVPMTGGVEVLKTLRAHPHFLHMPVVIVSGSAYPLEVEECYRLGASSYICKPFTDILARKKMDACVRYWFETVELPHLV